MALLCQINWGYLLRLDTLSLASLGTGIIRNKKPMKELMIRSKHGLLTKAISKPKKKRIQYLPKGIDKAPILIEATHKSQSMFLVEKTISPKAVIIT